MNDKLRAKQGFTMVELLLVIVTVAILGVIALPKFLNFAEEGRVASATQAANALKAAVALKKQQMMLQCGMLTDAWPCLDAINQNDIRACGQCTSSQVNNEDAKFLTNAGLPDYLQNGHNTLVACLCATASNADCMPADAGYCFWEGDIRIAPSAARILANVTQTPDGGGGESSASGGDGDEDDGGGGVECDSSYSLGLDTLCHDACDAVVLDDFCVDGGGGGVPDCSGGLCGGGTPNCMDDGMQVSVDDWCADQDLPDCDCSHNGDFSACNNSGVQSNFNDYHTAHCGG